MSKNTGRLMRLDPEMKQSPMHVIYGGLYPELKASPELRSDTCEKSLIVVVAKSRGITDSFIKLHLKDNPKDRKYVKIGSQWDFNSLRAICPQKVYLAYRWDELLDSELIHALKRFKVFGAALLEWDYGTDSPKPLELKY